MSDIQTPQLTHQHTSKTLHEGNPTNIENNDQNVEGATPSRGSGYNIHDILLLLGILFMQILPWTFFSVVWANKGIPMNKHVVGVMTTNPHATTYLITLICSIFAMIVTAFFSLAIVRFAQEWVSRPKPTEPFHIEVLLAFRHQNWPWEKTWKGVKSLLTITRFWLVALVVICLLAFPNLVSNTTSLITPGRFNRTEIINGTELDLSSTNADCLAWFKAHPMNVFTDCGWKTYNGLSYKTCIGGSQIFDAIEAGHGNILELLPRNTSSLSFSQLGGDDGMHFLGAIQGILPNGPGGVPAFNNLQPSPFKKLNPNIAVMSYNYTLNYQGLSSNISCSYQSESPIKTTIVENDVLEYNASCSDAGESQVGGSQVPTNMPNFVWRDPNTSTLTSWICQSAQGSQTPSYSIYLRGLNHYADDIGNITCTASSIRSAIFPVTYRSIGDVFQADDPIAYSPIVFPELVIQALLGLGDIILDGQNAQDNVVAESVITYGANFFDQTADQQSPKYLELYEKMIQGILEYEITYLRLIYSTIGPPPSCIRTMSGSFNYAVYGWFVKRENITFLLSMTIINLAALIALILAMVIGKASGHGFKALDPRKVVYSQNIDHEEAALREWRDKVAYQPTTIFGENMRSGVTDKLILGVENATTAAGDASYKFAEAEYGGIADGGPHSNS